MSNRLIFLVVLMTTILQVHGYSDSRITANSPNNELSVEFLLDNGTAKYRLLYQKNELIAPSTLGFKFQRQAALLDDFTLMSTTQKRVNESWQKVWGQSQKVENHYQELVVKLQEKSSLKRQLTLIFRVFDEGIGFRYQLPEQVNLTQFSITSEETEFALAGQHNTWWTPADFDSYEATYRQTPLSEVNAVNTPITLKAPSGVYISIHEAALTNYAGMTLQKQKSQDYTLVSNLVPWPDGIKVKGKTPFKTPWRTIQVAKSAGALIESDLIVNLNDPSVIADTSWIKPMKYVGIWWGMHMRKYSWQAGPKHGATTENSKDYINFAKQHNIGGVLVEGWNKGWETWHTGLNIQDFTQAYDDFDLAEVAQYARENGVILIGHHETGGNIPMYEQQMEAAFKLYHEVGVHAIKTGYAGKILPQGIYHHGQQMVEHYRQVVELAAKYQIMVNAHEPIKPTGIRRTYPNMMTREGGRGMEWNGWSAGNSPEHTVTLPFTRLLAGPMDYTPGIFNIKFDPQQQYRVNSTLAKQLAMYVTLYSPLQMAADMIENYIEQPAFEFIEKVPTTWHETKVLKGEIGDYISIARRHEQQWFIGSMSDEQPRVLSVKLDFLLENITYIAQVFADAKETDFYQNPTAITINNFIVKKGSTLTIAMAGSGGQAVHLYPIKADENKQKIPLLDKQNQQALQNMSLFSLARRYGEIDSVEHLAINKKIKLMSQYDKGYSGGGDSALIDGIIGGADYKTLWQGYRKKDLDIVIDLGELTPISSINIGFLQSVLHSILLPSDVTFALSNNGEDYTIVGKEHFDSTADMPDYQQKQFQSKFERQSARFIRVTAQNLSNLPAWHSRSGQESFIFSDEIIVH
ncbi:MAG: alpha-glucosidase [Alteromonadaceae bacterium]|jgi:alpha-glucosidase